MFDTIKGEILNRAENPKPPHPKAVKEHVFNVFALIFFFALGSF